jgi:hypothetical protein
MTCCISTGEMQQGLGMRRQGLGVESTRHLDWRLFYLSLPLLSTAM